MTYTPGPLLLSAKETARLRRVNAALLEACQAMLRTHAPTINGLCKICHHYGDDCEANKVRAALALAEPKVDDPHASPIGRAMIAAGAEPITLAEPKE